MALHLTKKLQDPADIEQEFPILPAHNVEQHRLDIRNVLRGTDPRLIVVVGPCSAWPAEAVRTYADHLTRLQEEVKERLLLVMRCYIQKPRTTIGWSGPLNQPDPLQPVDIEKGIHYCTQMMHAVGQQVPLADEMLFTHNADYFNRFLSYLALGARSTEDMEHRFIASGADIPLGVKNTTGGSIEYGVNGVLTLQHPHTFPYHQHQATSDGNPDAHLILRGGGGAANYDPQSIAEAEKWMHQLKITNPAIIIDASHDNSRNGHGKDPELQSIVVESVMRGILRKREEYRLVRGFMMESFLKHGKQNEKGPHFDMDGLSITDPCLGWEQTQQLIRETADSLDVH